jgi:hypothetical protein
LGCGIAVFGLRARDLNGRAGIWRVCSIASMVAQRDALELPTIHFKPENKPLTPSTRTPQFESLNPIPETRNLQGCVQDIET